MTYRFQWCDDCIHHETDLCDACEAGEYFESIESVEIESDLSTDIFFTGKFLPKEKNKRKNNE